MVGACGAKVQMIKYTGGSPQQSRDGGLTGSLGTKKKILGVISIVVVGELDLINSLTGKLGKIPSVLVKTSISKKEVE